MKFKIKINANYKTHAGKKAHKTQGATSRHLEEGGSVQSWKSTQPGGGVAAPTKVQRMSVRGYSVAETAGKRLLALIISEPCG